METVSTKSILPHLPESVVLSDCMFQKLLSQKGIMVEVNQLKYQHCHLLAGGCRSLIMNIKITTIAKMYWKLAENFMCDNLIFSTVLRIRYFYCSIFSDVNHSEPVTLSVKCRESHNTTETLQIER